MQDKSTNIPLHVQQLPAGVAPNDHNIEFVGCRDNKTVIWLQRGHSNSFNNLPQNIYSALEELFLTDQSAFKVIINLFPKESHNMRRLVEIYTYYMYGDLDKTPDVINGDLQESENYRHSKSCLSMLFDKKNIDINGVVLSNRSIKILDYMAEGLPDKQIAEKLNITLSTFDFHKKQLYTSIQVNSKPEAVAKAFKYHIICEQ